MKKILVAMGESFINGLFLYANLVFVGFIFNHFGKWHYVLPFILVYSFGKSGLFLIKAFGDIECPYRLIKYNIALLIIGSGLMIGWPHSFPLEILAACLIGLGSSTLSPFYAGSKNYLKERDDWHLPEGGIWTLVFMVIDIFLFIYLDTINIRYAFALFLFYAILSLILSLTAIRSDLLKREPLHLRKDNIRYLFPTITMFIFTFSVMSMRQDASDIVILLVIMLTILMISNVLILKEKLREYNKKVMVLGALQLYFLIYAIMYYTVTNQRTYLMCTYLNIIGALVLSALTIRFLMKKIKNFERFIWIGAISSVIISFLPNAFLISLTISNITCFYATNYYTKYYMESCPTNYFERRIRKMQDMSVGGMIQQAILLIVILFVSIIVLHSPLALLTDYAMRSGSMVFKSSFYLIRIICSSILLGMILILKWHYHGKHGKIKALVGNVNEEKN